MKELVEMQRTVEHALQRREMMFSDAIIEVWWLIGGMDGVVRAPETRGARS